MCLWIKESQRWEEGEQGFFIVMGKGSSIWKFWSGGPFWPMLRSKPSDVDIYWAADENKETAFDILCPSVCPQTNRMKGWPLIPPCLLPFSQRPTAKQPAPTVRGNLSRTPPLYLTKWWRKAALSTKLNSAVTLTFFICCVPTSSTHSEMMLGNHLSSQLLLVVKKKILFAYLCERCGCSLFWIPERKRKQTLEGSCRFAFYLKGVWKNAKRQGNTEFTSSMYKYDHSRSQHSEWTLKHI